MSVDSVSRNGDKMNELVWVNHFYLMSLLKGPSKLVKSVSVGEKLFCVYRNQWDEGGTSEGRGCMWVYLGKHIVVDGG
jgi:hypothetical protein